MACVAQELEGPPPAIPAAALQQGALIANGAFGTVVQAVYETRVPGLGLVSTPVCMKVRRKMCAQPCHTHIPRKALTRVTP